MKLSSALASASSSITSIMAASTETTDPVPQVKFALITIAIAAIPSLAWWVSKQSKGTDWLYKAAWVGAFIVNLITVSIPGRFDGRAETTVDGKVTIPWKSLFEPSGWAFAIWGVIYASELLVTAYVGVIGQPSAVLTRAAPFWLMGNLFQSLWCFAFRKEFASILWLPMSLLALGAASLGLAHNELTVAIDALSDTFSTGAKWRLLLLRLPLALHTGWLSAASLLNLNAWMSVSRFPLDRQITTAFLSAYLGAALGAGLSVRSGDPFIAFTVAWALAALADRTLQKVKETPALVSADTQSALAMTEKMLSYALVAVGMGAGGARAIF